jgi:hypothetical protein
MANVKVDHYKKLEHKSLNKEARCVLRLRAYASWLTQGYPRRRRELLRITADNQAILARIQVGDYTSFKRVLCACR